MNKADFEWEIVMVRSKPSRALVEASNPDRRKAATLKYWTAWDRVWWKISDLEALHRLRAVARQGHDAAQEEIERVGFENATEQQHEEWVNRLVEMRVILTASLTETKVLLDLLSAAVVTTLGQPGKFKEKHGGVGVQLEEYARAIGAPPPDPGLVTQAKELDQRYNELRDKVVTHPQPGGKYGRAVMQPRVGSTTDLVAITMYPQEDLDVIAIEELERELGEYLHQLIDWISSAQPQNQ